MITPSAYGLQKPSKPMSLGNQGIREQPPLDEEEAPWTRRKLPGRGGRPGWRRDDAGVVLEWLLRQGPEWASEAGVERELRRCKRSRGESASRLTERSEPRRNRPEGRRPAAEGVPQIEESWGGSGMRRYDARRSSPGGPEE